MPSARCKCAPSSALGTVRGYQLVHQPFPCPSPLAGTPWGACLAWPAQAPSADRMGLGTGWAAARRASCGPSASRQQQQQQDQQQGGDKAGSDPSAHGHVSSEVGCILDEDTACE